MNENINRSYKEVNEILNLEDSLTQQCCAKAYFHLKGGVVPPYRQWFGDEVCQLMGLT